MYTNTWYMIANTAKTNSTYCAYLHPWNSTNESSFERFMLFELFFLQMSTRAPTFSHFVRFEAKILIVSSWEIERKYRIHPDTYAPVRTHMRTFSSSERKMSEWAEIQTKTAYEQKKCQLKIQVFIAIKESVDCRWIWQKHAHPPRSEETYCMFATSRNISPCLNLQALTVLTCMR